MYKEEKYLKISFFTGSIFMSISTTSASSSCINTAFVIYDTQIKKLLLIYGDILKNCDTCFDCRRCAHRVQ